MAYSSRDMLVLAPLGSIFTIQWRHNGCDGVSNHQPNDCLLNRLFGRKTKKTSKLRVTGLWEGNSPVTGEFPAQMASNAEMFPFDDVIMISFTSSVYVSKILNTGSYTTGINNRSGQTNKTEIYNYKYSQLGCRYNIVNIYRDVASIVTEHESEYEFTNDTWLSALAEERWGYLWQGISKTIAKLQQHCTA